MSHPPQGAGTKNPISGESTGQPKTEQAVTFDKVFQTAPHVVLTAIGTKKEVCVTEITTTGFKWNNDAATEVTVSWIADEH